MSSEKFQCPYCLSKKKPIEVHGHLQCAECGRVIDSCCGGSEYPDDDNEQKKKPKK